MRNTTTVALPPTGRSALVYGASTGIEPHFSLEKISADVRHKMAINIGKIVGKAVRADELAKYSNHPNLNAYLACAQDIDPVDHLGMVSSLQQYTDEAISKTINMPAGSKASDVAKIYRKAYDAGTSGITIYVNGSHTYQPVVLYKK